MGYLYKLLGATFVVVVCVSANWALLARHYSTTTYNVMENFLDRRRPHVLTDGIAPAFKQTSQTTCGAAAITYLLTRMGDLVFEQQFIQEIPLRQGSQGYSLLEIAEFVESRGFKAAGYLLSERDLPQPGDLPVLAHLSRGHFVVVLARNNGHVSLFDPALGETISVPLTLFLEEWSGRALVVTTSDLYSKPGIRPTLARPSGDIPR